MGRLAQTLGRTGTALPMDTAFEDAPIEICAYDTTWPMRFQDEQNHLRGLLAPWLVGEIEHIGSTAIPGLAAKPIIDIMAPVLSLAESEGVIEAAKVVGYLYYPCKPETMHWFCKPSPTVRTHHLHVVPMGSQIWNERLAFRDKLRRSPELVARYEALKIGLAIEFKHNRDEYTAAKGPFILSVIASVKHQQ